MVVVAGLVGLAVFYFGATLMGRPRATGAAIFIWVWLAASILNGAGRRLPRRHSADQRDRRVHPDLRYPGRDRLVSRVSATAADEWRASRPSAPTASSNVPTSTRACARPVASLSLLPEGISEDDLIAAVRDCDLLLMCYTPVTARVIAAAEKLKGIVKYGVGIDAIDIPAAIARGIPVVNVPEYAEETVAEGAFALMIALAKKLMPIGREMDAKGWAWPTPQWLGLDLAGRTLGIVGTGKIGRSMARMASGFRMRVIGYDPYVSADQMRAGGIEKVDDLRALLRRAISCRSTRC